jgi:two-component sensor histidine kinase
MSLVHEKLYQSGDLSSISIDTYIHDLAQYLAGAAGASDRGIEMRLEVEPLQAPLDLTVSLGLLINELISNCFKCGFADNRRGYIKVSLQRLSDETVALEVADDGMGTGDANAATKGNSLGLKLVTTLSRQLGGHIETDYRNGARTRITFKLAAVEKSRS